MAKAADILFVHGGPGLNCEPERRLLGPKLAAGGWQASFWDEPSGLRSGGPPFKSAAAYSNWLRSLNISVQEQRPKILVALSFGALGVLDLLESEGTPTSVERLVLIGPTLNLDLVFRAMIRFSILDYQKSDENKAAKLKSLLETEGFWTEKMQAALSLVWQNPGLLAHYFVNPDVLSAWIQAMSAPGYQMDLESQAAVLNDLAAKYGYQRKPLTQKYRLPVTVFYGERDPVFDLAEVRRILEGRFESVAFEKVESAAHAPHLEFPEAFLSSLKKIKNGGR